MTQFSTDRLQVAQRSVTPSALSADNTLADFLRQLLVAEVTAELPPDWQGDYDRARALRWLDDREAESEVLFLQDRGTPQLLGLLILVRGEPGDGEEIRIGYLLLPAHWGKGLASELLRGLVEWARTQAVGSLIGGVSLANIGSQRVLQKAGFVEDLNSAHTSEKIFVWKP